MILVSAVVGCALIVAQVIAVLGFLRFVKSFGAYTQSQRELTSAILTTHESNVMLHRSNMAVLEELRRQPLLQQRAV